LADRRGVGVDVAVAGGGGLAAEHAVEPEFRIVEVLDVAGGDAENQRAGAAVGCGKKVGVPDEQDTRVRREIVDAH
jgi:hypothetical protein